MKRAAQRDHVNSVMLFSVKVMSHDLVDKKDKVVMIPAE
jgi:hypothetical protein